MRIKTFIFLLFINLGLTYGQLRIDTSKTADFLVKEILLEDHALLKVKNVNYKGTPKSIGSFKHKLKYNSLINKGLIMSSGDVFDAIGPNNAGNVGLLTSGYEDKDLTQIVNERTFDAAVLNIRFIPFTDSLSFNFFFASEEYPRFVGKRVNDVFAFYLIDDSLRTKRNLALLPDGKTSICINNVNHKTNSRYYTANKFWSMRDIQKWRNDLAGGELAYNLQYNGFTKLLHIGTKVVPYKKYRLKIAIADAGDHYYDSAIFLEANSFSSPGKYYPPPLNYLASEFDEELVTINDSVLNVNYRIHFKLDSYEIEGKKSHQFLNKVLGILRQHPQLTLQVNGHTDNLGNKTYNKELSRNRAKRVTDYLIQKGIPEKRITFKGFGASRPIDNTKPELNRRVEFVFKN